MAVHDLGYRGWSGRLAPPWSRTVAIAEVGIRHAWQSRWLHRLVGVAWIPACWFAVGFFVLQQALLYTEFREMLTPFLQGAPVELRMLLRGAGDLEGARHSVWAWLLYTFFRYPQGFLMVLVVGLIAPQLVSQDLRSRAFVLYFSRPLSRTEYILGKFLTVWFYLAMISTLPAIAIYAVGAVLSPQIDVFVATWDLPLRIVGASAVLAVPTAALALWISSMTQESRYAGFAWFAVWVLGWVTYGILTAASLQVAEGRFNEIADWSYFSLFHTLGHVQSWVFGFTDFADVRWAVLILAVVTIVSLGMLYRRVSSPLRV